LNTNILYAARPLKSYKEGAVYHSPNVKEKFIKTPKGFFRQLLILKILDTQLAPSTSTQRGQFITLLFFVNPLLLKLFQYKRENFH